MNLPKSEEQVMQHLWQLGKAFMKDLVEAYPDPKPASTTIATLLKRLQDKGAIGFNKYGSVREYYPIIKKEDYSSKQFDGVMKSFFNDSVSQFASFFTSKENLTDEELEELRKIVDAQIKNRKQ
ncbi:BlaI/MecI/CopY family transcriptional regulator [Roseivirga sp.]|uniref:BlaI/MecI/CopY family transcriptional regulator n=1 Tax=Roseivirga sp. TaxID=1964215 RepID=UPI003B8ABF91